MPTFTHKGHVARCFAQSRLLLLDKRTNFASIRRWKLDGISQRTIMTSLTIRETDIPRLDGKVAIITGKLSVSLAKDTD